MTITTPTQETRARRRSADETAAPTRRRPPAERRDDAVEEAAARPAKTRAARSGATGTTTRSAETKPAERRARRSAAKRAKAPATKPAAKPAKPAKRTVKPATGKPATRATRTTTTTRSGRQVKVTVVRRTAAPPRAPFVLLVVGLLGGALVSLLLLNTVLAQDAFTLSELQRGNQQLSERKQALQEDINRENSPQALHAKAKALGMVDGKRPAFMDARTGQATDGGIRPPGVSDDAMAAAAGAGVAGAPGAIMPPAGGTRSRTPHRSTGTPPQTPRDGGTGGGTR
jgi:hypothetical protein